MGNLTTTDIYTQEKRSDLMSRVKSKNTKPELAVRSILHRMGYRFRLHRKDLPGIPDLILPKFKTVIFVHGCFWHQHEGCKKATLPKQNADFWLDKLTQNIERDRRVQAELEELGWQVFTVWECEVKKGSDEWLNSLILHLRETA
jgi:DNA mismatch endonuclease (patch repair protein)